MSRIELHCPSCGYDVPMTLLPPPSVFMCPGCNEETPREKLTRLKVLHRNIAGAVSANVMSAKVVGSNFFFDPTQATASITVSNCIFAQGDICVVCAAYNLAGGPSEPGTATVGGASLANLAGGDVVNDQGVGLFHRGNLSAGSKSVVLSGWGVNVTACAVVVVAVSGGKLLTSAVDGSAVSSGTAAAFDTTSTSALTASNELAIAMVGSQSNSVALAPSWNLGFLQLANAHVGTNSGGPPNDTLVDVAVKLLTSTAAVHATGTLPLAVDNASIIATFKPL